MRVLIIEDEALIAWRLEELLREHGYSHVDIAASEDEAIAAAVASCLDLIVAEHNLISGSGVKAVQRICKGVAIATVFVTADPNAVRRSIPGAMVLPKPARSASIWKAIETAIEHPLSI